MGRKTKSLTEQKKIRILIFHSHLGNRWTEISQRLSIPESTIRSFVSRYEKSQTLNVQRGRPSTIPETTRDGIVGWVSSNADITLSEVANDFDVSEPFAKKVLNENGITCQRKIAVTPLTEKHKNTRVMFCNQFSAINYASIPTIIFIDESSIQLTRERKICWKKTW